MQNVAISVTYKTKADNRLLIWNIHIYRDLLKKKKHLDGNRWKLLQLLQNMPKMNMKRTLCDNGFFWYKLFIFIVSGKHCLNYVPTSLKQIL